MVDTPMCAGPLLWHDTRDEQGRLIGAILHCGACGEMFVVSIPTCGHALDVRHLDTPVDWAAA